MPVAIYRAPLTQLSVVVHLLAGKLAAALLTQHKQVDYFTQTWIHAITRLA